MSSSTSMLTATQKYAAGALFALALHQAQIHQTTPLGFPSHKDDDDDPSEERVSSSSSSDAVSDDPHLWVHPSSGLLRPVFKFLEIDSRAWDGLEETVAYSPAKHHVGAFLRLLAEDSSDVSAEAADQELALSNSIEALSMSMEKTPDDYESKKEKQREYEHACREKFSTPDKTLDSKSEESNMPNNSQQETNAITSIVEEAHVESICESDGKPLEEVTMLSYPRKVTVLYELLSACLADTLKTRRNPPGKERVMTPDIVLKEFPEGLLIGEKTSHAEDDQCKHGDASIYEEEFMNFRLFYALKWAMHESIETMIACSAMALLKEEESKEVARTPESSWAKWKRGGIIGAAALTGGTLMAVTGGLAAPAIAAGFGALAPTLGTIIPVIGASGFAAVASAAGSVAGSVAVAASFGDICIFAYFVYPSHILLISIEPAAGAGLTGSKMARRVGDVDEFEFKAIGENHNQGRLGVEISVSGFVFEEEDFVKPWEGQYDNLERYVLKWESKNLIAVSTAIQDWLTSSIAMGMMKQGAMMTVLSSLLTALAWPATLFVLTDFIDSKWTVAVNRFSFLLYCLKELFTRCQYFRRSDKAGKLLAEVLLKGLQGQRPVTLIGFSLGARVIFRCLQVLSESESNAGLVERVVLLGAPIAIKDMNWEATRKVVAGRYVNAYSTNDWMLGIAFRANLLTQGLAGIQPVDVPALKMYVISNAA
ncbi:hypothetical protein DH2020_015492 [Rehmannia glutinosa]|uniref:Transmembrane and coiled-coil domain-containing protein n=1 Tax=Rehmannia glutinosa TaxID=99300 RepID=A0ABR0WTN6_REHGL